MNKKVEIEKLKNKMFTKFGATNKQMSFGPKNFISSYQKQSDELELEKIQQEILKSPESLQRGQTQSQESLSDEERHNQLMEAMQVDYSFYF